MRFVRHGSFRRKHDGAKIPRYRCLDCHKTYSDSTFKKVYRQKKPYLNSLIFRFLSSTSSQRRLAVNLGVNRKTIVRKFLFLGRISVDYLPWLNSQRSRVRAFDFDDLETFEHTKCKPLSVIMAVEHKTRWIMDFRVASMKAKGPLAKIAKVKYGPRTENRQQKRRELFKVVKKFVETDVHIRSDENPHYAVDVKEFFPEGKYESSKGRAARSQGLGELKKGAKDPLFSINHTFAMCRYSINRMIHRTWCTTKKPERLRYHLAIYSVYHNLRLLQKKEREVYANLLSLS